MYKITWPSFIIMLAGFLFFLLLLLLQNDFLLHSCTGINDDHITIFYMILHVMCAFCFALYFQYFAHETSHWI